MVCFVDGQVCAGGIVGSAGDVGVGVLPSVGGGDSFHGCAIGAQTIVIVWLQTVSFQAVHLHGRQRGGEAGAIDVAFHGAVGQG